MASDDDEDIKRAIALSLGQADPGKTGVPEIIDLEDDHTSKASTSASQTQCSANQTTNESISNQQPINRGGLASMLGLDRKQMEAERLARKRKRSPSPASKEDPGPMRAPRPIARGLQFAAPTVKRTSIRDRLGGDDISLAEVLQSPDLRLAVFSSFQWDMHWLFSHLRKETKKVLVMQAKEQSVRDQYLEETKGIDNLRLCFPNMTGQINCMHSKLMILSYENHLRLVIPTANLVSYDWGLDGTMENMVFLVDLPRLPDSQRTDKSDLTAFAKEIIYFLEAQGLDQNIVNSLCCFDFSATKDIAFVHTIGGAHTGQNWKRTGYPGLAQAVRANGLATTKTPKIDFVTSSVGALNLGFILRLQRACRGDDFSADVYQKGTRSSGGDSSANDFHIYFPTHETVSNSLAGSAGTICMQSKYFEAPNFPRHMLRDCRSKREGVLMHNKIIFVRPSGTQDGVKGQAWAYIGSANCSESAWGNKLVKNRETKGPKLNCRNWECGVLIRCSFDDRNIEKSSDGLGVFEGIMPVPMQWPGEKYGHRKPWYFLEED